MIDVHSPRCEDCGKAEYPPFTVSYTHPDVTIHNAVTNEIKVIPGKPVTKHVCTKCKLVYEKVGKHVQE
jgi:hypothetical protein